MARITPCIDALRKYTLPAALVISGATCEPARDNELALGSDRSIGVPRGETPIMTDGSFTPGEWDDAEPVAIDDSITILFKQNRGHVFIGVKCPDLVVPVFDLFISPQAGEVYQLHISAQLGERRLNTSSPDTADPDFVWGRSSGWYGNEIRWDAAALQRIIDTGEKTRDEAFPDVVFPFDGAEFQIRRSKFNATSWRVRLEVASRGAYDNPVVFPAGTERKDTEGWMTLVFQGGG